MPDEATPADDGAAFRAAFIAEHSGEPTEGDAADESTASGDADEASSDETASDGESSDDADASASGDAGDGDGATPAALDLKAIEAAVSAKDPELLLKALGERADELLGTKAHKALSHRAKEIRQAREKLVKAGDELKAEFGEPASIRAAAKKGDVDAVVAGVERFFGAPWGDFIKFVKDGLAGQPARLEAKAQAEAAAKAESETRRQQAEAQVREAITTAVKAAEPKLLELHPAVVQLVFETMRAGYQRGIDTPAKALAKVKQDLQAQHAALSKVFSAPQRRRTPDMRPPGEGSGRNGREMTPDEFRREFVSQFTREQRAGKRGAL